MPLLQHRMVRRALASHEVTDLCYLKGEVIFKHVCFGLEEVYNKLGVRPLKPPPHSTSSPQSILQLVSLWVHLQVSILYARGWGVWV